MGKDHDGKTRRGKKGHADKDVATAGSKAPEGEASPVRVLEKGSFAIAVCDCGWGGPARRARKRAREDAAEHLASATHRG